MEISIALVFALVLILCAEFVNGWTDAPNAIATVISTRTLSPKVAVMSAAIFNIAGAFYGKAVAATIGKNMMRSEAIDLLAISAAMFAIVVWSVSAWYFEIPTSESHALVAGLSGAALAVAGPSVIYWDGGMQTLSCVALPVVFKCQAGWGKALQGLLWGAMGGMAAAWVLSKIIMALFGNSPRAPAQKALRSAQIFSSMLMAFSHGSNDGQKFMGAFALALLLGGAIHSFEVPFWVIILCAVVMGLGTSVGGMRIIKTMGFKMVRLETYQGFSAEAAAAATILTASSPALGIPLSTTHTINMAIVGTGLAKGRKSVDWKTVLRVVAAWILTFPACGLLAYVFAKIFYVLAR